MSGERTEGPAAPERTPEAPTEAGDAEADAEEADRAGGADREAPGPGPTAYGVPGGAWAARRGVPAPPSKQDADGPGAQEVPEGGKQRRRRKPPEDEFERWERETAEELMLDDGAGPARAPAGRPAADGGARGRLVEFGADGADAEGGAAVEFGAEEPPAEHEVEWSGRDFMPPGAGPAGPVPGGSPSRAPPPPDIRSDRPRAPLGFRNSATARVGTVVCVLSIIGLLVAFTQPWLTLWLDDRGRNWEVHLDMDLKVSRTSGDINPSLEEGDSVFEKGTEDRLVGRIRYSIYGYVTCAAVGAFMVAAGVSVDSRRPERSGLLKGISAGALLVGASLLLFSGGAINCFAVSDALNNTTDDEPNVGAYSIAGSTTIAIGMAILVLAYWLGRSAGEDAVAFVKRGSTRSQQGPSGPVLLPGAYGGPGEGVRPPIDKGVPGDVEDGRSSEGDDRYGVGLSDGQGRRGRGDDGREVPTDRTWHGDDPRERYGGDRR